MLGSDAGSKAVRASESNVTRLNPTGHVVCFGCGVDDLVDCLHGKIEGHEFTLASLCQLTRRLDSTHGEGRSIPRDVSLPTLPLL